MRVKGSKAFVAISAVLAIVVICFGVFELWALATGNRPITGYVQTFIVNYGAWAALILYLLGVITGALIHHFWDHPKNWPQGETK